MDAARVAAGDPVMLQVDGTGATISGTVVGVGGAVDPATQSAQVLVRASVPAALAGSSVSARIVVANDRGIIVPKDAVVADPSTQKTLVFVAKKNAQGEPTFDAREVNVIFENETSAEVRGLRPGERIAATGAFELLPPAGGGD